MEDQLTAAKLNHWRRVCDHLEGPPHPLDLVLMYLLPITVVPSRPVRFISVGELSADQ